MDQACETAFVATANYGQHGCRPRVSCRLVATSSMKDATAATPFLSQRVVALELESLHHITNVDDSD